MDPISFSASLLTLFGAAGGSCKFVYNFILDISDAPSDIRSHTVKLRCLQRTISTLIRVYSHAGLPPDLQIDPTLQMYIVDFVQEIESIKEKIEERQRSLDRGPARHLWERLKWVSSDRQLRKFYDNLDHWNTIFKQAVDATNFELSLRTHTNTELLMTPIKDPEGQFLQPIVQDTEKQCYQQCYQQTQPHLQTKVISNTPQNELPKRLSTWLANKSDPVGLKVQSWGEYGESLVSAYLWVGPIIVRSWSRDYKEEYRLIPAQDGYGLSYSFHANWMIRGRFTVTAFALYKLRAPYNFNIRFNVNIYAHLPTDSIAYNACVQGDWLCLRQLLADGKVGITDKTQHGDTLVHIATRNNNSATVLRLLEAGADANAANDFGQTPLHIAVHQIADYDNSRYLIAHGANLSNQDLDGKTPLHTLYNNTSQQLIQFNQDSLDNTIQDFRGMTIAHYVAWSKSATTSDILRCTKDNTRAFDDRDERGRTLLHLAFTRGNIEVIQYLINLPNFDASSQSHIDWQGRTLLHYATESRRCGPAIDLLLNKGLDIHARDSQGRTVLHHAAGVGNLEAVKKLYACGAALDLVVLDKDSRTPVQVAALCGNDDVVEYLQGLYGPQPLMCEREYGKDGRYMPGRRVGRASVLARSGNVYVLVVLLLFLVSLSVLHRFYSPRDEVS